MENNDEEAQTCFNLSLDLVKQSLISNSKNRTREGESTMDSSSSYSRCIHQQSHSIPFLRSQDCFIYNKAISFILDDEDEDTILEEWYKPEDRNVCLNDDSSNNLHLYSAIIILNIALAYHRQAMIASSLSSSSHPRRCSQQGTTSRSAAAQEWRTRAEKMYDMVTMLLEDVDGDTFGTHHDEDIVVATNTTTALLVKIAAVNNLSQLRREMGDYESSRDGFEYLGELIDFAEYHLKTTLLWNQEDTIMGMLLNVLLATSPEAAGAA